MGCDLHTHSTFSDGTFTPTEIIRAAKDKNLAVALTDHNTLKGLCEFNESAKELGVEIANGIELSCDYQGKELHLVGLFIDEEHFDSLQALTDKYRILKEKSNIELIEKLKGAGYELNYRQIKEAYGENINRAHIGAELLRKGYVASVNEAFERLLNKDAGFYNAPPRLSIWEAIEFLKNIKAIPILAHPFLDLTDKELEEFLFKAKKQGLQGMETLHSSFSKEQTLKAKAITQKFNLIESGGSDFHGQTKPKVILGEPYVSKKIYNNLKRLKELL